MGWKLIGTWRKKKRRKRVSLHKFKRILQKRSKYIQQPWKTLTTQSINLFRSPKNNSSKNKFSPNPNLNHNLQNPNQYLKTLKSESLSKLLFSTTKLERFTNKSILRTMINLLMTLTTSSKKLWKNSQNLFPSRPPSTSKLLTVFSQSTTFLIYALRNWFF